MTRDDLTAVAAVHVESWRTAYRGILSNVYLDGAIEVDRRAVWESRRDEVQTECVLGLVLESAAHVMGFAYVMRRHDATFGDLLENLHVHSTARGQGHGRRLLREAARVLSDGASRGLYLWVYTANVDARRFYEREGARLVDEAILDAADGARVPAVRYAWRDVGALAGFGAATRRA